MDKLEKEWFNLVRPVLRRGPSTEADGVDQTYTSTCFSSARGGL
jgi:hypothetical protein